MDNKQNNSNKGLFLKTATVSLVAGLLGGGISYYGMSQVNDNQGTGTTVSVKQPDTKVSTSKNSTAMTNAFNQVKGAVVSVVNLQKKQANASEFDEFFGGNSNSKSNKSDESLQESSEGSGVIYLKSNGKAYIVTNNHVVDGSDQLNVILSNGKTVSAKLVGADSVTDLAVLSIDAQYATQVASFGSSKNLEPGQAVIAIGSPLGSEYATSVTQGIVSANNRTINITDDYGRAVSQTTVIQTDAAINPGNSGGPLVNESGQIVGINSMKMSQTNDGSSVEGMGFAIPSDEVVTIINKLVKDGKITRPQLGIRVGSVAELSDSAHDELNLPKNIDSGVFIASVIKNSAASKVGLKSRDVITNVDGKEVTDVATLHSILYTHKIGDKVTLTIYRDGQKKNVSLNLQ